ncbi:hypothetical protein Plhal304r1_c088g0170381 [Plasmopara halstedii]
MTLRQISLGESQTVLVCGRKDRREGRKKHKHFGYPDSILSNISCILLRTRFCKRRRVYFE